MKQYTSRFYKAIAVIFLGAPFLHVLFAAILFDIPANLCLTILLSPFYYVVTFVAVLAGYGLWETRRWSWYLFVLAQVLITYQNALFVSNFGETHHKVVAFLVALLLQLIFFLRVSREIRVPYFFPKIRWWESDPKLKLSAPARLLMSNGEEKVGQILDISSMGCFVKIKDDLRMDEKVTVITQLYDQDIHCSGSVVWCAQTSVTHPQGVGIKFDFLSKPQRRTLRLVTLRLKRIASFYRSSRYLLNPEELIQEMEQLEKGQVEEKSLTFQKKKR